MTPVLPIDRLYSVGVVVRDLEASTRRHAELFGIDRWEVREFDPGRLGEARSFGRAVTTTFRTATGTTPNGKVVFELVQPVSGENPFHDFRARRGQGISHLTLAVVDPGTWRGIADELAARGLRVAASYTVDGILERHFVDTRAALGGYYVEVRVPVGEDVEAVVAVDEIWDHSGAYDRQGHEPLPVGGVSHFGVVVHDMRSTLERYHELFGVNQWGIVDWTTSKGSLECPYYRGEQVEHGYYTGLSAMADFGFEVIQPTYGPSDYNVGFLDRTGEGIHHALLSFFPDKPGWDSAIAWMEAAGAPQIMGADLNSGVVSFCYFDTGPLGGGYVVEAVVLNERPDGPPPNDYDVDFDTVGGRGPR